MAEVKPDIETFAKIKVVGLGGGGNSAVNRMVQSKIRGVDFITVNTDLQALHHSLAPKKIHVGKTVTRGLGAGMDPELGRMAAEENITEIREALMGADMVFLTAGLGGGTGSGVIPVVARVAKELGALTIAIVTKPFYFEGSQRRAIADGAHDSLSEHADTVVTIPNDRVLQVIEKKTSLLDAFQVIDDILRQAVQGISELITIPGLINVDFADVRSIMSNAGSALMGIGTAKGEDRAMQAAKAAISSPLLELSIDGAKGILFTITGNADLGMMEVSEAAKIITSQADPDAKIIFGTVIDDSMEDNVKITVVATGFDDRAKRLATAKASAASVRTFGLPADRPKVERNEKDQLRIRMKDEEVAAPKPIVPAPAPAPVAPAAPVAPLRPAPLLVEEERVPQVAPVAAPAPRPIPTPIPRPEPVAPIMEEEEDLEIPAFLRKKML